MNGRADSAIYTAFDDFLGKDPAVAERNLMRAILRTAFEDIRKRGDAYRHARSYILSNDDRYIYSFRCICYHLNLCPLTIRSRLGLLKEHEMERLAA